VPIYAVALSTDNRYLYCGGADKHLRVLDVEKQDLTNDWGEIHNDYINVVKVTTHNRYLFTGCRDGVLKQWLVRSGRLLKNYGAVSNDLIFDMTLGFADTVM
jgi:WD40 repeat protein